MLRWEESWGYSIARLTSISAISGKSWTRIGGSNASRRFGAAVICLHRAGQVRNSEYATSVPQDIPVVLGDSGSDWDLACTGFRIAASGCTVPLARQPR